MLELLAPAGSMESITAAVQNGADAVYFGYGDFNARRNAKNFSAEEAAAAVSYCHLRGCKVHLTLNTLLTDRELAGAAEVAAHASAIGVDAVIVAGDLFDTFNPPVEAIELLYRTLHRLARGGQRLVVAIAGNHDSPDRVDSPDVLARESGIFFAGNPMIVSPTRITSGSE